MQKIKLTIPCQYDNFGYTYKPYEFTYKVDPEFEQNIKLNSLIHDEIKKLSWNKLKEWKKTEVSNMGSFAHFMPDYYVENIGQLASNNIFDKCKTVNDINNLYEQEENLKKIKESNTCRFCGLLLENCSINCLRHKI